MGGEFVQCVETGRVAWMKPGRAVYREKGASDLAHEIGLAVPPALLHRGEDGDGQTVRSSISLVCHEKVHELPDILPDPGAPNGGLTPTMIEMLQGYFDSRAVAFDAWLGINGLEQRESV